MSKDQDKKARKKPEPRPILQLFTSSLERYRKRAEEENSHVVFEACTRILSQLDKAAKAAEAAELRRRADELDAEVADVG